MKTMRSLLLVLLATWILSCEENTGWDLNYTAPFPVADCILTNEMRTQELVLRWSESALNDTAEVITGAFVTVSDGANEVSFTGDPDEPGKYLSSIPFMAVAGIRYRLTIAMNGYADTAYAEMVGVEPLDAIDWVRSDSLYRFVYHHSHAASMMEVEYDWSTVSDFAQHYGAEKAKEVFYTLDNIDPGKEFAPERVLIRFPIKTSIIRRRYSLSEEHQAFVRALLLETEWRGGFFDAEPGNVPTNFTHGIRGWFAACSVVSDTSKIE